MNIDWASIFDMILDMITQCRENRSKAEILAGMCDPGPREAWNLRVAIRTKYPDLSRKKVRKAVREGISTLQAMGPEAVSAMVDEALAA